MISSLHNAVHLAFGTVDKVIRDSFIWSVLFHSSDEESSTSGNVQISDYKQNKTVSSSVRK